MINNLNVLGSTRVQNDVLFANDITVEGSMTISGNTTISNDLTIAGDLKVQGSTTTIESQTLVVEDTIVQYGLNNVDNTKDSGYFAQNNVNSYSGLVWDASNSKHYMFDGLGSSPASGIDYSSNTSTCVLGKLETNTINQSGASHVTLKNTNSSYFVKVHNSGDKGMTVVNTDTCNFNIPILCDTINNRSATHLTLQNTDIGSFTRVFNSSGLGMSIDLTSARFSHTTTATSTSTGSVVCGGGVGISGDVYIGSDLNAEGKIIQNHVYDWSIGAQISVDSGDVANDEVDSGIIHNGMIFTIVSVNATTILHLKVYTMDLVELYDITITGSTNYGSSEFSNIHIIGDYLYFAFTNDGSPPNVELVQINIADLNNPVINIKTLSIGRSITTSTSIDLVAWGDYLYAGNQGLIHIVSIQDPDNITERTTNTSAVNDRNNSMVIRGNWLIVNAFIGNNLYFYTIADDGSLTLLRTYNDAVNFVDKYMIKLMNNNTLICFGATSDIVHLDISGVNGSTDPIVDKLSSYAAIEYPLMQLGNVLITSNITDLQFRDLSDPTVESIVKTIAISTLGTSLGQVRPIGTWNGRLYCFSRFASVLCYFNIADILCGFINTDGINTTNVDCKAVKCEKMMVEEHVNSRSLSCNTLSSNRMRFNTIENKSDNLTIGDSTTITETGIVRIRAGVVHNDHLIVIIYDTTLNYLLVKVYVIKKDSGFALINTIALTSTTDQNGSADCIVVSNVLYVCYQDNDGTNSQGVLVRIDISDLTDSSPSITKTSLTAITKGTSAESYRMVSYQNKFIYFGFIGGVYVIDIRNGYTSDSFQSINFAPTDRNISCIIRNRFLIVNGSTSGNLRFFSINPESGLLSHIRSFVLPSTSYVRMSLFNTILCMFSNQIATFYDVSTVNSIAGPTLINSVSGLSSYQIPLVQMGNSIYTCDTSADVVNIFDLSESTITNRQLAITGCNDSQRIARYGSKVICFKYDDVDTFFTYELKTADIISIKSGCIDSNYIDCDRIKIHTSIDVEDSLNARMMSSTSISSNYMRADVGIFDSGKAIVSKPTDFSSATGSITQNDYVCLSKYSTTGTQVLTLPILSSCDYSLTITIKDANGNCGVNSITVNRSSLDTIDGGTSTVLSANYASVTLFGDKDNNEWHIL